MVGEQKQIHSWDMIVLSHERNCYSINDNIYDMYPSGIIECYIHSHIINLFFHPICFPQQLAFDHAVFLFKYSY